MVNILELHRIEGIGLNEIKKALPDSVPDDLLTGRLDKMTNKGDIRFDGNYFLVRPSFADALEGIDNERTAQVIACRINGQTLEEIAQALGGLTRERVRQIESNFLKQLSAKYAQMDEDKYAYIYTAYELNRELMKRYLGFSDITVYYLENRYKETNTKQPVDERMLDDPLIPDSLKRKIEKYIFSKKIRIGNEYVEAKRNLVEEALFPILCKDAISYYDFVEKYNEFVTENQKPELLIPKDNIRVSMTETSSLRTRSHTVTRSR